MSTITKQWLQQTIADMEEHRDLFPGDLDDNHENVLAALRIALASLEAEDKLSNFVSSKVSLGVEFEKVLTENLHELYVGCDTAPPTPVSESEPMKMYGIGSVFKPKILSGVEVDCDNCSHYQPNVCHGEGCPAAMLQGADGDYPVIPDGLRLALSNAGIAVPESDEMLAATCEKYIQELVTWVKDRKPFRPAVIPDGWVACSERMPETMVSVLVTGTWFHHTVSFWDGSAWCDLDFESPVTHWMPLPAAPQQE